MSAVDIRPLDSALQKIAIDELHEEPDKIHEYLEAFREWIKKSPHLKSRVDDQFLVMFLRGCKYSLERAKQKLDMYYTLRTHIPELMLNRDPLDPKLHQIIKMGIGLPLPILENSGSPRLFLVRPGAYDASLYTIQEVMKVSTMVNDILMRDDDNLAVAGQVGILDLANVTMAHFLQFHPSFIKKMTMLSQEGSPVRQKGFHYINTPKGFEQVFSVFKSFMNEKNRSRLFVHGSDMESLYKVVPRRLMPSEYGGEAGPLQDIIDEWEQKILSYRQYFQEDEEQFGVEEKKRVGRPKSSDLLFGAEGTFRQLEFD